VEYASDDGFLFARMSIFPRKEAPRKVKCESGSQNVPISRRFARCRSIAQRCM
jgi:hypothetical protein